MSPSPPAAVRPAGLSELAALGAEAAGFAKAGVPLEVGLGAGAPGGLSARLAGRLREGMSLEDAWRAERGPLPRALGAVLAGGVRAGDPGGALTRVASHAALVRDLRGELAAAAAAPLAVVGVAAGLAAWALPPAAAGLAGVLEQAGAAVPATVEWVAALGSANVWWRLLLPVAAVGLLAAFGRLLGWRAVGVVPGLGAVRREFRRATACHLLGLLTGAQVPLGEALRLAAGTLPASDAARLTAAADRLDRGDERAAVFAEDGDAAKSLSPLTAWALGAAPARELPAVLREASDVHVRRARAAAARASAVLPTAAMLVVGGGVVAAYTFLVVGPAVLLVETLLAAMNAGGPR